MRCHCLQSTHTVIVLSPTLAACHHFSACLLHLSSSFPSAAQLQPLLSSLCALSVAPSLRGLSQSSTVGRPCWAASLVLQLWLQKSFWSCVHPERPGSSLLSHCDTTYLSTYVVSSFFSPSIMDITTNNMLMLTDFILGLNSFCRINFQGWNPWANGSEFCIAFTLYCHVTFQKRLILLPAVYQLYYNLPLVLSQQEGNLVVMKCYLEPPFFFHFYDYCSGLFISFCVTWFF